MTEIYLSKNHLMIKANYENPEMHRHSASHILVGLHENIQIITKNENIICRGALIPSGMEHTIKSFQTPQLVFLFDNTTMVSEQIQQLKILNNETAKKIVSSYELYTCQGCLSENYAEYFSDVMNQIGIRRLSSRITDARIIQAMHFIEKHISDNITLESAANISCLSESRFSHLFSQQAGITFSGYLVLRKLYHAYLKIAEGASITEAALTAGFSSSAHFATVNKKTFGITASDIRNNFRLYEIADI